MKRLVYSAQHETKDFTWKDLQNQLEEEFGPYELPLYTQTDASKQLNKICREVEEDMNVVVVYPDSKRKKNVVIRNAESGSKLGSENYQYFNDDVIDWALGTKSESQFKKGYRSRLEALIEEG